MNRTACLACKLCAEFRKDSGFLYAFERTKFGTRRKLESYDAHLMCSPLGIYAVVGECHVAAALPLRTLPQQIQLLCIAGDHLHTCKSMPLCPECRFHKWQL